jgi:RHS repeat-associated protein
VASLYGYGAAGLCERYAVGGLYYAYTFDPSGNLVERFSSGGGGVPDNISVYTAFGTQVACISSTTYHEDTNQDSVGFGGQWGYYTCQETSSLTNTIQVRTPWTLNGLRYYDPAAMRFLTRDPIGYDGGINLYAFCGNNPVMGIDPLGLDWLDWVQGVADAAGLVPALNIPAEAISGAISLYHHDYVGAGLSVAGMIPFAGDAAVAAKVARRAVRIKKSIALLREAEEADKLAKAGEDLFVGTYGRSYRANVRAAINNKFTAHHVVQNAVSTVAHDQGITINIRQTLHRMTRTFGRSGVARNLSHAQLRSALGSDVKDLRIILRRAGYDRRTVNRQMRELIRQNLKLWGGP